MYLRSVLHFQGILLLFCAAAMLTPLPFSIYYGAPDIPALLLSSGITALAGLLLYRFMRLNHELRAKEGFAIVTLGWLLLSLFGALPFILSGAIPDFTDAFFETMSGFTTTGATVLADIEAVPVGVLFWRSLTHWMGGMGIIVFSLAVLPMIGTGGMQLYKAEVAGPTADKLTPRVASTAKILWGVYVLITAAEVILLLIGGMDLYNALAHAFGTVASGGFSTKNLSIAAFHSPFIDWVVIVFMVLAGTNFALHYRFLSGDWRAFWRDREFHAFIGSIAVASLLIGLTTFGLYEDKLQAVREILFAVTSLHTSTGFALPDYEQWSSMAQFTLLLAMLIGGSAGSTSGGIKVIRVYLVAKFIGSEFTRSLHPQAVAPTRVHGVAVPREIVLSVLGYFCLYLLAVLLATLLITGLGLDWVSGLSAVISCLGGVGPGMNLVGPFDNYGSLHPLAKWLLSLCMLLGRLEFYTFLILFTPAYWRR